MRAFGFVIAIIVTTAVLAGCGAEKSGALAPLKTDPAAVEEHVAKLATESFVGEATAAADVAAVRDALPPVVSLSWGGLTFDDAAKATVLTAVKLTPADMPEVGLSVDEVRLWDFDADFAKARLAGQRLDETASLARRIELKGARIFGIETLMAPAMDAYTGAIEDTVASIDPSMPPMQTSFDSYDFSIGRIVIDDVMLRPYQLKLVQLPPENEFAQAMPVLQPLAAVMRTFAADTVAAFDFRAQMAMTQLGQSITFDMTADTYGVRGLRGGDNDVGIMRNLKFDMAAPNGMPEPASGIAMPSVTMAGSVDYGSFQQVRFDKLYGYVARGEWPPRTEKDLLSYGLVKIENQRMSMNGHDVFSVGAMTIDARTWRWFVPTKVSFAMNDVVYDIKALMDFATEMAPASAISEVGALDPDASPVFATPPPIDPTIMQLLTRYGLDKPSIDLAFGWDWNADTGATAIDTAFGLDNYMRFDITYEGGFPTFDGVSALIPGGPETAKGEEIARLFEAASTLNAAEFNLADEGGLAKIFALASEAGKSLPPEATGGVAIFANATPQGLRQTASAGVYMLADQAELEIPGTKALIAPFGAFVDKGGKIRVIFDPKAPLNLAKVGRDMSSGMLAPVQLLRQLNGKTAHTPPPAQAN